MPMASDLLLARVQMGFTLAFHIVFASVGVGLPLLMLYAERRFLSTGDPLWKTLARRWSAAFGVLFAVGAASGTVLSFELGLLWPGFMGVMGPAVGLPFTIEGFAFFAEAIFLGIYLYGWDRLSPRLHWLCGFPLALGGAASAFFVTTANAFMNTPAGITMEGGRIIAVDPLAAMFNKATATETLHTLASTYMVTGFLVAGVYAFGILRGRDTEYRRRAMVAGLVLGSVLAPLQALIGDFSAQMVAREQPAKFAAMEGHFRTEAGASLLVGGWPDEAAGVTRFAIRIPAGLSFLAFRDFKAVVRGWNDLPAGARPPVVPTHVSFQLMVACGMALITLGAWAGFWAWKFGRLPRTRWFLLALVVSGPLAIVAMETGWMVTEIGRQPWMVRGLLRVSDSVTAAPGMAWLLAATVGIYLALAAGTAVSLRLLGRRPIPGDRRAR